jgi:hypothetical protein
VERHVTAQILWTAIGVYIVVLIGVAYFSRTTRRRFLGALAGGLAVAMVGVGVETFAHAMGWWRYPSVDTPYGPLLMYPLVVLFWAVLSLIGWRVVRRFGWRGELVFLAAVTVQGIVRDYLIAGRALGFIVLAPGITVVIVDAVCWAALTGLAQAVMWLVAGPAASDRLAHRRSKCR